MTAIDHDGRRRILTYMTSILMISGLAAYFFYERLPPQIGTDEGLFRTVDALFTAINCRDKQKLDDCERRLHDYRKSGTLSTRAGDSLDSIIQQARSGLWERSARRLYDFMRGQRRT